MLLAILLTRHTSGRRKQHPPTHTHKHFSLHAHCIPPSNLFSGACLNIIIKADIGVTHAWCWWCADVSAPLDGDSVLVSGVKRSSYALRISLVRCARMDGEFIGSVIVNAWAGKRGRRHARDATGGAEAYCTHVCCGGLLTARRLAEQEPDCVLR